MNPRNTGILLVVALGLGALLYFYELGGEQGRLDQEEASKRLFRDFELEDVSWIALKSQDGVAARFERREEGWWMVAPVEFPAAAAVGRMAEALVNLTSEAVFETPQPDAEYGLDDAKAKLVRFGTLDGERELRLGRDTPVGSNRYARTGDAPGVYTVASYRTTAFDSELDAWREAKLLDFDTAAVRELEVRWPGVRVVAERMADSEQEAGETWRLRSPLEAPADEEALDRLLSTLSFLRAEAFVDEPGAETLALLEPPELEVELRRDTAPEPLRLELSRPDGQERRYARVAGRSTLFELPADRIDDFPRKVAAYRDRSLTDFSVTEVENIDFFFRDPDGDPVVIRARRGGEGWTSEPEPFEGGALSSLVSTLSRLEADDILAESAGADELEVLGLAPPNTIVTVFGAAPEAGEEEAPATPQLAELHLGQVTPEGIVARVANRDTLFRLSIELTEQLPVSLEAFRNRFRAESEDLVQPPPEAIDSLELPSPAEESP